MEEGVKHSAHFLLFLSADPDIAARPSAEKGLPEAILLLVTSVALVVCATWLWQAGADECSADR